MAADVNVIAPRELIIPQISGMAVYELPMSGMLLMSGQNLLLACEGKFSIISGAGLIG